MPRSDAPPHVVSFTAARPDRLADDVIAHLQEFADGDATFMAQVLGTFLHSSRALEAQLLDALTEGNAEHAARTVHTLKSSSALLSGRDVAQAALHVEDALRSGDLPTARARAHYLISLLGLFRQAVHVAKLRADAPGA